MADLDIAEDEIRALEAHLQDADLELDGVDDSIDLNDSTEDMDDNTDTSTIPVVQLEEDEEPTTIEDEDEDSSVLGLYSHNCLRCTELVSEQIQRMTLADKATIKGYKFRKFTECHYIDGINKSTKERTGNPHCPAAKLRLVKGINIQEAARQFKEALEEADFELLSELSAKLSRAEPVFQERVKKLVGIK